MHTRDHDKKPYDISLDDITVVEGIDAVLTHGKRLNTLAVKKTRRDEFFSSRVRTKRLISFEPENPPIEEGAYRDGKNRDRDGELAINTSAARVLIEKYIKQLQSDRDDAEYHTENCFLVDNNRNELLRMLEKWKAGTDVDLKINFVDDFHHISVYLRREHGKVRCLVIDPEPKHPVKKIIRAIQGCFDDADIIYSTTPLQVDYYSCSVYALNAMKYFVKHGGEVFQYLDTCHLKDNEKLGCRELKKEDLMPELLKMAQETFDVPEVVLNKIVSAKKNLTLREYLARYAVRSPNKSYNAAAIVKRYHYLEKLENYLDEMESSGESRAYVDKITALAQYCETGDVGQLSQHEQVLLRKIQDKFPEFRSEFMHKFDQTEQPVDLVNLHKFMFVAAYIESENLSETLQYSEFAKNLYALFDSVKDALAYLHRHAQPGSLLPVHDACLFSLPKDSGIWDPKYWRNMAMRYGKPVVRVLPLAPRIDVIRAEQLKGKNQNKLIGMNELQRLQSYAAEITYKNADQHPELAALCMRFNKSEEIFEKCLRIVNKGLKKTSYLPEFVIRGEDIAPQFAGLTMQKLPTGDLRGFFLGELTNCCQNIGGPADRAAMAGMCSPYADFYVIHDSKGEIVAQLYAWISRDNKIVFDSWEPKVSEYNYLFKPFITSCVVPIMQAGFAGVNVGLGGRTPKDDKFIRAEHASVPVIHGHSCDASSQMVICETMYSQQEKLEKLKQHSLEEFSYLLDFSGDALADEIIQHLDTISADQLVQIYEYFIDPLYVGYDRTTIQPYESTIYFILKLYACIQMGQHVSLIRAFFQKLLDKDIVRKLDFDAIISSIKEEVSDWRTPDSRRSEVSIISAIINLVVHDVSNKYTAVLDKYIDAYMMDRIGFNHNDHDYSDEDVEREMARMYEIINDEQAPLPLRRMCLDTVLQHERDSEKMLAIAKRYLPIVSLRSYINDTYAMQLIEILKIAVTSSDVEFMRQFAAKMAVENIGSDELGMDHLYFRDIRGTDATLPPIALEFGGDEAVRYFFEKFSNQADLVHACSGRIASYQHSGNNWVTLIGKYVLEDRTEKLDLIRSIVKDDTSWHPMMMKDQSVDDKGLQTALHLALAQQKYSAAAAIIRGYKNVRQLHELMLTKNKQGRCPLDYLTAEAIQKNPEGANMVAAAIRKAYSGSHKLLQKVTGSDDNRAFMHLLMPPKPKRVGRLFTLHHAPSEQKKEKPVLFGCIRKRK